MSQPIATTATRAPALPAPDHTDHADHADRSDAGGRAPRPSRIWALAEALAYAGAYVDPSGILAVQRLRWAEEEERRARR